MLLTVSVASVFAQSSLIATLSHEGEVSQFYGVSALRQAHEAAVHGDVITLSSGTFTATNITKAITLRGVGMEMDTITNTLPTVIAGDFGISIERDVVEKFLMEGIYHNHRILIHKDLSNATFISCRFYRLQDVKAPLWNNVKFIHCMLVNDFSCNTDATKSNISFINCYVANGDSNSSLNTSLEFTNCIYDLNWTENWAPLSQLGAATFRNCVIISKGHGDLSAHTSAYNCVAVSEETCFNNISNKTNTVVGDFSEIFKTYTGVYSDTETFELTDEAKSKYLGLDGTQIGIYGGNLPYSPKTSAPQITKFNVAAKSTADGKLSVDIEVNGVE